jgi:pimeloyl-ACP methyl ester carboxylesterase
LGFGLSDKPETAPYKPDDHRQRLLELVRKLDLRDITLVVHDFGGPIGLPVALEEPGRVRDVVVINSWMWANPEPSVRRLSSFIASPLGRFLYKWLNASPRWLLPASFADKRRLSPEVHRHYLAPFASRHERVAPWVLGCELWGSNDYYGQLWSQRTRLSSLPLTVLWGMKDPAIGVDQLGRWREAFPAARVVELADAGHFPQEEADVAGLIAA